MTTWRLVLVVVVAVMVGFVGGVWFIGSGVGFELIQAPQVAPVRAIAQQIEYIPRGSPDRGSRGQALDQTKIEAVGVPEPVNLAGGWGGLGRLAERSDLVPSPGCSWEVEPREFRLDQEWHKSSAGRLIIAVPSFAPTTGRLRVSLIQTTQTREAVVALRFVLFDAAGHRFVARVTSQGSSSGTGGYVDYTRHDWDDVPVVNQDFAFCGVERVPPDSARQTAEAARTTARLQGVPLLPPPRLGEPFEVDLTTLDGKRVRMADLRGKAVLVVITGPFPSSPNSLQQIRKEFPESDLAVINISFEATPDGARQAGATLGKPTFVVQIPNEPSVRQLWREGVEIQSLPTYWIVDPAGILRFQPPWHELSDRIATALGRLTRQGKIDALAKENNARASAKVQPEAPPAPVTSP